MNHDEIYPICLEHPNPKLGRFQVPVFEIISLQFGHVWELVHEHLKRRSYLMQDLLCYTIHNEETQEATKSQSKLHRWRSFDPFSWSSCSARRLSICTQRYSCRHQYIQLQSWSLSASMPLFFRPKEKDIKQRACLRLHLNAPVSWGLHAGMVFVPSGAHASRISVPSGRHAVWTSMDTRRDVGI